MFADVEDFYLMRFDEQGVAAIPTLSGCRDRGTVTIKTNSWCKCPKAIDLTLAQILLRQKLWAVHADCQLLIA